MVKITPEGRFLGRRPRTLKRGLQDKNHFLWNDKITDPVIRKWLNNFTGVAFPTAKEHSMARYLLSKFVLIRDEEVRHLCVMMLRQYVLQQLSEEIHERPSFIDSKYQRIINRTRFLPVEKPSKSGYMLAYYFSKVNSIPAKYFPDLPTAKGRKHESLCLLDDVSLTGDEVIGFLKDLRGVKYSKLFLLAMIVTRKAVDLLSARGVRVIAPIVLGYDEMSLGARSTIMMDLEDEIGGYFTKNEYETFLRRYGDRILPDHPLGYGGLALLFGFHYNVPDNTVPVIWQDTDWFPIFKRLSPGKGVAINDSRPFF